MSDDSTSTHSSVAEYYNLASGDGALNKYFFVNTNIKDNWYQINLVQSLFVNLCFSLITISDKPQAPANNTKRPAN